MGNLPHLNKFYTYPPFARLCKFPRHPVLTTIYLNVTVSSRAQHSEVLHLIQIASTISEWFWVWAEAYLEPCQTSKMELFANIVKAIDYFGKKLHLRYLTGLWIRLWGDGWAFWISGSRQCMKLKLVPKMFLEKW